MANILLLIVYPVSNYYGMHIDMALLPHSLFTRAPEYITRMPRILREGPLDSCECGHHMVQVHRSSLNNKCELKPTREMGESNCDSKVF
jgi:hypothetical protein